jgi:hypothetical protein
MRITPLLLATGTILAAASTAHAEFVDMVYVGTQRGMTVKVTSAFASGDLYAGQILNSLSNGPSGYNGVFVTYCCDLGQYVPGSPTPYEIVDPAFAPLSGPMGAAKAAALSKIYTYAAGQQLDANATNEYCAAFQLAAWEIIYDFNAWAPNFGLNLDDGSFKASATDGGALSTDVITAVDAFFAAVAVEFGTGVELKALVNETNQDQLIVVPGPGASALLGVAGMLALRRRRR